MPNESYEKSDISQLVQRLESEFISGGGTRSSKYVTSDLYEDISRIYAYLDSKFIEGDDNQPFFNIVISARNIWYRATDIDRKNIKVKANKRSNVLLSFAATVKLQDWMKREDFGSFLNKWGMDLAGFNSSVVKFVSSGGELHCNTVPWSKLIVDQVNFDKNPQIEILEMTEAELYSHPGYDKKMVEKLCDAKKTRELTDKTNVDNKGDYIKLYEIHGNLPLSYLTGKERDEDTYVQQMHVISLVASKAKGGYDDFTLYAGREAKSPYMLTSLLPSTDGSISLDGSVKNLFNAQWMQNETVKTIREQLAIASKLIFQTSDGNFVGQNAISAIDNGDILIHQPNQPLTQINNGSHDIVSQQNFGTMWKSLANEINGISEAMLGNNPPSGSAWRQTEALLQESHSLFELMTENKGLAIEKMLREYVIPHIKTKLNSMEEVSSFLDSYDLKQIDAKYVRNESLKISNKAVVDMIVNDDEPTTLDQDAIIEQSAGEIKNQLSELGNQRFFKPSDLDDKTWKDIFKDMEWEVEVDVTGEAQNTMDVMTTLNTALQIAINPTFASNPKAQLIVDKILSASGLVSPLELSSTPNPTPSPIQPSPVASPVVGGSSATPLPGNPMM